VGPGGPLLCIFGAGAPPKTKKKKKKKKKKKPWHPVHPRFHFSTAQNAPLCSRYLRVLATCAAACRSGRGHRSSAGSQGLRNHAAPDSAAPAERTRVAPWSRCGSLGRHSWSVHAGSRRERVGSGRQEGNREGFRGRRHLFRAAALAARRRQAAEAVLQLVALLAAAGRVGAGAAAAAAARGPLLRAARRMSAFCACERATAAAVWQA